MEIAEHSEDEPPGWQRVCVRLAVGVVAAVGAVVSYGHLAELARMAGEVAWWLVPASVDGLIVAGTLSAWHAKRTGAPVPAMTKLSLTVGLVVSVAANAGVPFVSKDEVPAWLVALVAAWPAVALALAFESLLRVRKRQSGKAEKGAANDLAADAASVPERAAERQTILPREAWAVWLSLPQAEAKRHGFAGPVPQRQSSDQRLAADTRSFAAGSVRLPLAANDLAADAASVPERAAEQTQALPVIAAEAAPDERAAARELVRSEPDGWTGERLGERFGKSARWGRDQIKAARDEIEAARRPRLVAVDE